MSPTRVTVRPPQCPAGPRWAEDALPGTPVEGHQGALRSAYHHEQPVPVDPRTSDVTIVAHAAARVWPLGSPECVVQVQPPDTLASGGGVPAVQVAVGSQRVQQSGPEVECRRGEGALVPALIAGMVPPVRRRGVGLPPHLTAVRDVQADDGVAAIAPADRVEAPPRHRDRRSSHAHIGLPDRRRQRPHPCLPARGLGGLPRPLEASPPRPLISQAQAGGNGHQRDQRHNSPSQRKHSKVDLQAILLLSYITVRPGV